MNRFGKRSMENRKYIGTNENVEPKNMPNGQR